MATINWGIKFLGINKNISPSIALILAFNEARYRALVCLCSCFLLALGGPVELCSPVEHRRLNRWLPMALGWLFNSCIISIISFSIRVNFR